MTKEHAYAYEAGYRDGSADYELEHCPACKNVADLQEALDENAKLRKDIRDLDVCCQILNDRLGRDFGLAVQLDVENAKLRKLVQDMWPFAEAGWVHTRLNRGCSLFEECDANSARECLMEKHMVARMRELGIEED